jgi:hypothetical protein
MREKIIVTDGFKGYVYGSIYACTKFMDEFMQLELLTQRYVEVLNDEADHPEIWELIKSISGSPEKIIISQWANYLEVLISIPQELKVIKLLTVLQAICLSHVGRLPLAQQKLLDLAKHYQTCELVLGALSHVQAEIALCQPLDLEIYLREKRRVETE